MWLFVLMSKTSKTMKPGKRTNKSSNGRCCWIVSRINSPTPTHFLVSSRISASSSDPHFSIRYARCPPRQTLRDNFSINQLKWPPYRMKLVPHRPPSLGSWVSQPHYALQVSARFASIYRAKFLRDTQNIVAVPSFSHLAVVMDCF